MIPPRPIIKPPPRRKQTRVIQLNRLFDDEGEIQVYLELMKMKAKIIRTWKVEQIGCEVEIDV